MSLLQMSFYGSCMILFVIFIRSVFIHKLPKRTFSVLWTITICRLLIPVSVSSGFSIYTLFQGNTSIANTVQEQYTTMVPSDVNQPTAAISNQISDKIPSFSIWQTVWFIGMFALILFFAFAYLKCCTKFKTALPTENDFIKNWFLSHKTNRPISIRQSDLIDTPLTFGFFHSVILLPKTTDWKNTKNLAYILEHEFVHILRFDTTKKLLLTLTLCIHWFNPLVWVMYILANRDIELACDETVIRRFGTGKKSDYARTLIYMEQSKSGFAPLCNNFNTNAVEERIEAIMKLKKKTVLSVALAVALIAGTTTVFATSAQQNTNKETALSAGLVSTYTLNGKTYYVLGDGTTLEESEYLKKYPTPDIEWWTYEEYQNWLEQQKQNLPTLIGQKGKINGKEFVWTQKEIDKAIAMYEKNLEDIKNGMLLSKTIDGKEDFSLAMNPNFDTAIETDDQLVMNNTSGNINVEQYKQYEKYGMTYNPNEQRFYYHGKLVRRFKDLSDDSYTTGFSFDTGEVDIKAQRNQSHILIGLEVVSKEEFDKYTDKLNQLNSMNTQASESGYSEIQDDTLTDYTAFGVVYNTNKDLWQYNGKDIYLFYDEQGQKLIQGNANPKNNVSLEITRNADGTINKMLLITQELLPFYFQKITK